MKKTVRRACIPRIGIVTSSASPKATRLTSTTQAKTYPNVSHSECQKAPSWNTSM